MVCPSVLLNKGPDLKASKGSHSHLLAHAQQVPSLAGSCGAPTRVLRGRLQVLASLGEQRPPTSPALRLGCCTGGDLVPTSLRLPRGGSQLLGELCGPGMQPPHHRASSCSGRPHVSDSAPSQRLCLKSPR